MIESFHRLLQKLFCRLGHFDTKAEICNTMHDFYILLRACGNCEVGC